MQKINSSVSFMIAYLFLFVGMEVNDGSVEDMTPLPPPPLSLQVICLAGWLLSFFIVGYNSSEKND